MDENKVIIAIKITTAQKKSPTRDVKKKESVDSS